MMAGIYARKSSDQFAVADEQKSVARQIDHARQYAARKGWVVDDASIFVDDGVSGAEFANRAGYVRLMNALKPTPTFQILIMSEESRLGRESIETAYALKQLVQANVRVFFYLEDRERTLDSPTDKIMLSLTTFADELEREKARQRTYDAMIRKARAGHVTGGRVFGYDNVEIVGADGRRSHVVRRINEVEAAIVRRIFELSAAGAGLTRITKTLNEDGAPAPRAQQGRPVAWVNSSVREILLRPLYRGEIVWNQTRKRDSWGQSNRRDRPAEAWVRVPAPALQIISPELWTAAAVARTARERQYAAGGRDTRPSHYLLSGLARCAQCGGGFASHSRTHGKHRVMFYACTSHWKRGPSVCANGLVGRMAAIDAEVLVTLREEILKPAIVERAITLALEARAPARQDEQRETLVHARETARAEVERLADAIQRGGPIDILIARLSAAQDRRTEIEAQLLATSAIVAPVVARDLERRLRDKLADWRELLVRNVESGRDVLRALLVGPLQFTPIVEDRRRAYAFKGAVALERLVSGVIELPTLTGVASPAGIVASEWLPVEGISDLKAA
jgi:site-specific DNA recombinase